MAAVLVKRSIATIHLLNIQDQLAGALYFVFTNDMPLNTVTVSTAGSVQFTDQVSYQGS